MSTSELVTVEVPDIGDFEDVPIIEILVSPGDAVAVDDPLLTLESDKATMDVPAPFAGVVRELQVAVGDRVSQGTPLLTVEPSEQAETGTTASAAASEGAPTEAAAPDAIGSAEAAETDAAASGDAPADSNGGAPAAQEHARPIYASPAVRRLARELRGELSAAKGTGRKGRIIKQDVEAFAAAGGAGGGTR